MFRWPYGIIKVSVDGWEAVAASLSHAHAEVIEMVCNVELPSSPLVGAGWILTGAVAAVNFTVSVLVLFGADVIEA